MLDLLSLSWRQATRLIGQPRGYMMPVPAVRSVQSDIDIISCFHEFVREPWCALPDTFLGSHLGLVYLLPNAPERHEKRFDLLQ